jgi:4,5-DOPA dioxygenase extradiol
LSDPSARQPTAFVGHGSPMNAIEDNVWSRGFRDLASRLPRPKAVLAVSAHWFIRGTAVTANEWPDTIHDFGGFPEELYEIQYLAKGDPGLADRVVDLLGQDTASRSLEWGLDHGTWSVLCHVWPKADVPVVQLSIDGRAPAARHLEIGRALAPLRDEGILILGSGNIVHNLGDAFGRMRAGDATTPEWASRFDEAVAHALEAHDGDALARLIESPEGRKAHPTPEHYLPLLYVAGAGGEDPVSFPITGFDLGSLSMRAVVLGGN